MAPNKSDKIIIVGAGVYGLSTTLSMLENGYQNIHLFDKNDYLTQGYSYFKGCDSASSDMNKIFRASYGEKTHYQDLAMVSRDKFLTWNQMIKDEMFEGGEPIYINSGNVHLTDLDELPEFELLTLQNMSANDSAIRVSDSDAIQRALKKGLSYSAVDPFNVRNTKDKLDGVLDTTGGIMVADKLCRWVLHLCQRIGGSRLNLHLGEEIRHLLVQQTLTGKKCVGIKLNNGDTHCSEFVAVFGGSWTAQIVPEANERLEATGGTVVMCRVDGDQSRFDKATFPAWTYKVRDGAMGGLYGFPISQGYMKIGYRGLKWVNPVGAVNSKTKTAYTEERETNVPLFGLLVIKEFIKRFIPQITKISMTRLCWYSDTTDNDFLISYCPYYEDDSLFVGAGDSGHAFMFFGCLGDVIRGIVEGNQDEFLTNLFSWSREREALNALNLGANDPRALQNLKMATERDWDIYPGFKL